MINKLSDKDFDTKNLQIGDDIYHEVFGYGKILNFSETGSCAIIRFSHDRTKSIRLGLGFLYIDYEQDKRLEENEGELIKRVSDLENDLFLKDKEYSLIDHEFKVRFADYEKEYVKVISKKMELDKIKNQLYFYKQLLKKYKMKDVDPYGEEDWNEEL